MNRNEYNGWTNYETWNVALWMDNEEGSYNYWRERARETWDKAKAGAAYPSQTREDRALYLLSEEIKVEHEEGAPDLGATVWADLLGAAMSEVNWYEIAEHLIADIPQEADA